MNHFAAVRSEAFKIASDSTTKSLANRVCLLFDLQGRIRILAELGDEHDPKAFEQQIASQISAIAGAFWAAEIWFDRPSSHPISSKAAPSEKALFEAAWREARAEPSGQAFSFVLDRRFSKESWFDTASSAPWPLNPKTPPIISFYSFKGGVGRTTALASIAIQCARAGKRVLLLDFDLEAPGLGSVFPPPGGQLEVGLVDYLLERPVVGAAFNVNEILYVFDDKKVVSTGEIRVVPAGQVDLSYLEKLSRLDYHRMAQAADPQATPPLHQLLKELRLVLAPDLILIDSRAGLHDLGGLALSALAHSHVLFGLDSEQSWAGLRIAISHLGRARILAKEIQRDCLIVQSQVRPQEGRSESEQRFRRKSYEVFSADYYDEPSNVNAEWPVPDEMAEDEPHFPSYLVHDSRVMGYSTIDTVADYLCEGDF